MQEAELGWFPLGAQIGLEVGGQVWFVGGRGLLDVKERRLSMRRIVGCILWGRA